ncbi:phenylacetate--CoA ligase [Ferrimonas sediminicola]|uniref:Phenylacetate--CoA ligase n=1 Tax=Ferrimonas sediminicola TaxID=2569538 RepID=A0A4V5NUW8_9GAMM|nr:AMP-binding protein [Ferrimonas sediminicola]TKB48159.1 phenylacetate--CoA ligase [Ferrimonas sediminicola]
MSEFFDDKECLDPAEREAGLLTQLDEFIGFARSRSPYYGALLAQLEGPLDSREALATLPVTRKSQLIELQQERGPLGGLNPEGGRVERLFQSPGPINEPENTGNDWWRMGRAFYAAGFRPGQLVQNCLSYHLSPGGFILDSGARACGCTVIPAGPGQTELQLEINASLRPQGYCGTPSFLKILLDRAAEKDQSLSFTHALVTGEALPGPLRQLFLEAGIQVRQAYATADIGLIAYESEPDQGLVLAEDLLVEIVRPGSGEPVADGEVGEVVVTSFNRDYPLVRFATGDLSAMMTGTSPCGRSNGRIKGWMGRADQTTKVKGMFVHPVQLERLRNRVAGMSRIRARVERHQHNDRLTLLCEPEGQPTLPESEVATLARALLKLGAEVTWVAPGSLPRDGIVIEDCRPAP